MQETKLLKVANLDRERPEIEKEKAKKKTNVRREIN